MLKKTLLAASLLSLSHTALAALYCGKVTITRGPAVAAVEPNYKIAVGKHTYDVSCSDNPLLRSLVSDRLYCFEGSLEEYEHAQYKTLNVEKLAGSLQEVTPMDHSTVSFDDVIYHHTLTDQPVAMGFGAYKVLAMLEDPAVATTYQELRKLGRVQISVQAVERSAPREYGHKVYTLVAHRRVGWTGSEPAGRLVVEAYEESEVGCYKGTQYRVSEIQAL